MIAQVLAGKKITLTKGTKVLAVLCLAPQLEKEVK